MYTSMVTAYAGEFDTTERFRIAFTPNERNDHVTMFILHLPLAVSSF